MVNQRVLLDTARFLDSPQAAKLSGVPPEHLRAVIERFLACAYDEVGKAPNRLDGDDVHAIVGHLLPGRFGRKDPAAEQAGVVLAAYLDFLAESVVTSQMYEMRRALESTLPEFEEAVRTGAAVHHAPHERSRPFVHSAEKVGRNDPCPCGSGKKFKKCCAQIGS